MNIDLNNCFPLSQGKRGPLPKQREFYSAAMDPKGPKFICFLSGIGAGKSLIGCITVLSWALLHKGDYLVSRLYLPELKLTTQKTFKEICPPELILEERVADGIIRIRCVGGGYSNIIFRGLDEPDKMRSLNLSGFYIDEACQVSESAFMLLMGRLRGGGLRKGILTTNPQGHDYLYRWFFKKDFFKDEATKNQYKLIRATSIENVHLPEGYVQSMLSTWSDDKIKREIYGDFDTFSGQVYSDFRRDIHVIKPFRVPDDWIKLAGADHGFTAPSAWVFGAMDPDGNVYIYKEYYEAGKIIEHVCRDILKVIGKDKLEQVRLDPSTRAARGNNGESDWDTYIKFLPPSFPLMKANNEKTAGIDRVKMYFKVHPESKKPKMFIFDTCDNLIEEITQYRYQELTPSQESRMNPKEEPLKYKDHACDALRYLTMALPDPEHKIKSWKDEHKYRTLEYSLREAMDDIRTPKVKDPFGD